MIFTSEDSYEENVAQKLTEALIEFQMEYRRKPEFIVLHSNVHRALCEHLKTLTGTNLYIYFYNDCRLIQANVSVNKLLIG